LSHCSVLNAKGYCRTKLFDKCKSLDIVFDQMGEQKRGDGSKDLISLIRVEDNRSSIWIESLNFIKRTFVPLHAVISRFYGIFFHVKTLVHASRTAAY
jgi:hypothetical protein